MENKFDVIIVGGGPGGYKAGTYFSNKGLKVALIEKDNNLGGVCLNRGCIPTKTLLTNSNVYKMIKFANKYGIDLDLSSLKMNWSKAIERKNQVITKLDMGIKFLMKRGNITVIKGNAKAVDKNTLDVNGVNYHFDKMIIATGSTPIKLNLPGFEQGYASHKIMTSDEALSLDKIPSSLTIIGGGVIGVEFANLFNNFGTKVTILEGSEFALNALDDDIKKEMNKILLRDGIEIKTKIKVMSFENDAIHYQDEHGAAHSINSEKVLVSIGRKANSHGFENIGLEINPRGSIVTNDKMQTNHHHIFAIGDVTTSKMLAHVAYGQARVAVHSILGKEDKVDLDKIPNCIYTYPEVASVGLNESEIKAKGFEYKVLKYQMGNVGKALADGNTDGFVKLIVDIKTNKLLGGHIIATHATDMISEIVVGVEADLTIHHFANAIHPHPSLSEAIQEAAELF